MEGLQFLKKELILQETLNIKTSSTADIDRWFTPEMLEKTPKAKAWVTNKGKDRDARFRKMKSSQFKKYLQEDHRTHRKPEKIRRRSSSLLASTRSRLLPRATMALT
ncbi:hypothetical protein B0H19DRAFT_379796 [Mycena capillaripes]|nr:hypothetical protein B0H19DRAFT_379796 [Mycena capillaripes]